MDQYIYWQMIGTLSYHLWKTYQVGAFHIVWGVVQTIAADLYLHMPCTIVCHKALDLTCFYSCEIES